MSAMKVVLDYDQYLKRPHRGSWKAPGMPPPGCSSNLDQVVAIIRHRPLGVHDGIIEFEIDDKDQSALEGLGFFEKAEALGIRVEKC